MKFVVGLLVGFALGVAAGLILAAPCADAARTFPASRSDRVRKLASYLPFLQAQWAAGEHNIAHLYQTIRTQGYLGSETSVRTYLTSPREEIGPPRRPRRYYPPVSSKRKRHQRTALWSRRATRHQLFIKMQRLHHHS